MIIPILKKQKNENSKIDYKNDVTISHDYCQYVEDMTKVFREHRRKTTRKKIPIYMSDGSVFSSF